jgi:cytochrome P450
VVLNPEVTCDAVLVSSLPPGPTAGPALQTMRWLLRPIAFMEDCRRRFGDAFSVRFLGFETPLVMVSKPEVLRALYSERGHGLPPGRTLSLRPITGPRSVLLLEGADHLSRRRVMLPPFHGDRMRAYEAIVREAAEREIARWPTDRPFAVHPSMQAITLEVILRAVFGVSDVERRARLRAALVDLLGSTASAGLQFSVLLSRRLGRRDPLDRLQALMAQIDEILLVEIAERRAEEQSDRTRDDICSLLVAARFEDGGQMEDREVRDQLMTLLVAGHETTATALAWTLDLVTHHPDVLARLVDEVGGNDDAYLRAVIAESLRLRPVVPLAGRRLTSELRADRLVLPAGTDVTPAIWLAHTRPDTYPEPYAFRPERFLERPPATYAWVPFGGGVRRCLGAAFAEMEMRVVLTTILRRRTLRPATRHAERVARRNVTFSPRNGTRIVAQRRDAGPLPFFSVTR